MSRSKSRHNTWWEYKKETKALRASCGVMQKTKHATRRNAAGTLLKQLRRTQERTALAQTCAHHLQHQQQENQEPGSLTSREKNTKHPLPVLKAWCCQILEIACKPPCAMRPLQTTETMCASPGRDTQRQPFPPATQQKHTKQGQQKVSSHRVRDTGHSLWKHQE